MSHFGNSKVVLDCLPQVSISELRQKGYFKKEQLIGYIKWNLFDAETLCACIKVYTQIKAPYLNIEYWYADRLFEYKILLKQIPSNLGKGFRWYFKCPISNNTCHKLYFYGGYFLHRDQVQKITKEKGKQVHYRKQMLSKNQRGKDTVWRKLRAVTLIQKQIEKKYFKTYYMGRITRRYAKVIKLYHEYQSLERTEIRKLIK